MENEQKKMLKIVWWWWRYTYNEIIARKEKAANQKEMVWILTTDKSPWYVMLCPFFYVSVFAVA